MNDTNDTMVCDQTNTITLSEESLAMFMDFLEHREEYLDTGLGAFHTDDHSNW